MKIEIDLLLATIPENVFCTNAGGNLVRVNMEMARKPDYTSQKLFDMKIDHVNTRENIHDVKKYYIELSDMIINHAITRENTHDVKKHYSNR